MLSSSFLSLFLLSGRALCRLTRSQRLKKEEAARY